MRLLAVVFLYTLSIQPLLSQTANDDIAYYCPPCGAECDALTFDAPGTCSHCGMTLMAQTKEQHEYAMSIKDLVVGFYLQHGVEVLDFAGPMEVLSYAGFNVITISKTKEPITSQGILRIIPDYSLDDAPNVDILATFGGNARRSFNDDELVSWVMAQDPEIYFSVCTGAFLLGKAGVLDGLKATTFHSAIGDLQKENPNTQVLENVRFVDNGSVITTAGISAGIDGALHLVHKLLGLDAAQRIAQNMEYDKWVPEEGLIVRKD